MSILTEIAARTRGRIEEEKFKVPTRVLMSQLDSELAKHAMEKQSFLDALRKPGMSCVPGDIDLLRPPVPQGAAGLFAPHDLLGLFEFFQHLGALLLAVTSAQALLRLSSPPRSIGSGSGFFQVFIG